MAAIALNPGIIHTEMLETCYGEEAAAYTLHCGLGAGGGALYLSIRPQDNGSPLTVPA
jgi:hypothetical protein